MLNRVALPVPSPVCTNAGFAESRNTPRPIASVSLVFKDILLVENPLYPQSGKAMARTGLRMMPTLPSPPLKFRTAGFPQYGFKGGLSEGAFPGEAPNCRAQLVCFPPSRSSLSTYMSPLGVGAVVRLDAAIRATSVAPPQGPSLRSGLCCPSPSSLNRTHPPHSRAHLDFAALRFIP